MKFFITCKLWPVTIGTLFIIVAAGCGRDGVKVYHVSDTASPIPPTAATAAMPGGLPAPDNSGLPSLQFTPPAGWEKKAPSAMRVASFRVSQEGKQADVSVIPMGGMAGGNLANVNRWRGQVGLGSIEQDAVDKMTEKVVIAGQSADLFDIAGAGSDRIIASVLYRDDTAWFFKITGEAALVEAQKPAFIAFLKSVSFGAPTAAPTMDMSQLPPSHPPIGGMNPDGSTVPANSNSDKPIWTIPSDWKQTDPGAMLFAKFSIAVSGGKAEVNILSAGGGGSLLANANRWRGQLGLPPVTQEDELSKMVSSIDVSAGRAQIVDFSGTNSETGKPARLIGAIVPQNGQTWFYKLMGDETVVGQQKDAFIKFVQSANYSHAP